MKTFRDRVYEAARQIPKGKVVTYGQLAAAAGSPRAARAVGMCMKTNPFAPLVPCHRVVAADGRLTGFSADGGVVKKKQLLIDEGVIFTGEKVNMKESGLRKL
jgi:methylated-DNA-[protein]-cysteine S-methyltransferase